MENLFLATVDNAIEFKNSIDKSEKTKLNPLKDCFSPGLKFSTCQTKMRNWGLDLSPVCECRM